MAKNRLQIWTLGYVYVHGVQEGFGFHGFTFKVLPSIEIRYNCGHDDGHTQTIIEFDWLLFGWQICFDHFPRKQKFRLQDAGHAD